MIAELLALLVQPTITNAVPGLSIDIPPVIAGQVIPYMNCTIKRSNADPRMPTSDPVIVRAIGADARAACADLRRRGEEQADRILRRDRAHRDPASRAAFIAAAFDQVDRASETFAAALESMNARRAPPGN
jgi:hypothetical protein